MEAENRVNETEAETRVNEQPTQFMNIVIKKTLKGLTIRPARNRTMPYLGGRESIMCKLVVLEKPPNYQYMTIRVGV
jgi:hypothetical protein